jgi:hypothetical protein
MPDDSTTPDLAELYQHGADAFNAGDLDTFMGFYAPHAVVEMVELFGTWEGRAAIRAFFEDWLGAFDEVRVEIVQHGRPRDNAGWVQVRTGFVSTVVDGLIERSTYYLDIDQASAAAERLAEERGRRG